jgi:DnaJ-domain-containing protein 1
MSLADYNYIGIALIFFTGLLGFVISRYFENIILRILAVLFGLALMSDGLKFEDIFSLAFGSGMVLAHVKYFVMYTIGVIKSILAVTYDLYTFGLTIYYKTRNVFIGIYNTYQKIANFFRNRGKSRDNYRSDDNSEQNSYYEEQEYQNFYQDDSETKEDNTNSNHSHYDDYFKNKQKEYSSNQNNSQQENKQEKKQEKKQQSNYDSKQEETKKEQSSQSNSSKSNNPYGAEYNQFFSKSMYTRLGLEYGANKKAIKKAYRKLAMQFHPDKNRHKPNIDMYEEIFKMINEANMEIG